MNDRYRSPDVPPRVTSHVVQVHVERATMPTRGQVATEKSKGAS
nr:MAG TPA: hypothetical protein [Caudoviricetes sp.]DAI85388.1 MAG TPA: hypothetical protein [Caudoviricetes sp.]